MRAVPTELSDSLNAFHKDFLEAGKSGTPLPARQMLVLARSFAILFRLAKNLEAELAIHRLSANAGSFTGGAVKVVLHYLLPVVPTG